MANILSAVAWPYANGPRHIGHIAGFGVPSDVFSRYKRMRGHRVLNVSGTDEHGTPIMFQAESEGLSPLELANKYNRVIVNDLEKLGLSYDIFTRTTTKNHEIVATNIFKGVYENGYLVKKQMLGAFEKTNNNNLPDRYIKGVCPFCGFDDARGDQCDSCGKQLDPTDLKNPISRVTGDTPVFKSTEHFFLDLPALKGDLSKWLNTRKNWRTNVMSFSKNLLKDMIPRAVTRDMDWGIPVPVDDLKGGENKRLYVWFDAVIGYLSSSIEWARRFGKTDDEWKDWWHSEYAESYYFMGKDNITFHTQIWPAELIGYNKKPHIYGNLNLPTNIVSSEFLTMEGKQFSSSRGVVIYVNDFLKEYQPDALRYFIAVAGPENQDSDFTWSEFKDRINGELVAKWGNLVSRVSNLLYKNFGEVPSLNSNIPQGSAALLSDVKNTFDKVGELMGSHQQKLSINTIMQTVSNVNKYITDNEPWALVKSDKEKAKTILSVAANCIYNLNKMLSPFLPKSANLVDFIFGQKSDYSEPKIKEVADLDDSKFKYPIITNDYTKHRKWEFSNIEPVKLSTQPKPIFNKISDEQIENEYLKIKNNL